MPEATTDTKGIKKLPKWSYIAIGGGAIILYLYYKKKKNAEAPPESAYTAQSFIPVTGENVAGAGASGGIGGGGFAGESNNALLEAQERNNQFILEFLKSEREGNRDFLKELIAATTGGGTPKEQLPPPTPVPPGPVPPGPTPVPPAPPGPPTPAPHAGCPSGFPKWNPARGGPGCGSCYRISRERAKKPGYVIHGYCDGHEVESR